VKLFPAFMKAENQVPSDPLDKELNRMIRKLKSEKKALGKILRDQAMKPSIKPKKSSS
jgi:hypothetical protein